MKFLKVSNILDEFVNPLKFLIIFNFFVADDENPYLISWRGIDALEYYQQDPHAERRLVNTSGCGNTFNSNKDLGLQLILHSLRTWVEEYHIDGFTDYDGIQLYTGTEDGMVYRVWFTDDFSWSIKWGVLSTRVFILIEPNPPLQL